MGQYWKIVNIDKQVTCFGGFPRKLGDLFFDPRINWMLHALARMPHEAANANGSEDQESWVGDRIICLGDYADDIPGGILSAAEEESLKELAQEEGLGDLPVANILYRLADVSSMWPETKREDGELALRNLTSKHYIRSLPLQTINPGSDSEEDASEKGVMFDNFPGFMQVLLMDICWSSDTSTSMEGGDTRGPWAGHRFDIVKLDDFRDELNNGSWKDISDETVESLKYIWEANDY